MFYKFSALALLAPLVAGEIVLSVPKAPTSQGTVTITWTSLATDPQTFSLELLNPSFNDAFAIANNIITTSGSITLTLPVVPVGDNYQLNAVNIGNINDVYASTSSFSIGASPSSASSAASSTTTGHTGTSTAGSSTGVSVTSNNLTTSAFGSTISGSAATSTSGLRSTTATSGTQPAVTGGAFNGAASFKMNSQVGTFAAAVLSAVAGAAIYVL